MKFGKYILLHANDWPVSAPHHLNYKTLKKIINSLGQHRARDLSPSIAPTQNTQELNGSTPNTILSNNPQNQSNLAVIRAALDSSVGPKEFQAVKTAFFYRLERELEKVNAFYLQKEAEFKLRLESLLAKNKSLQTCYRKRGHTHASDLHNLKDALVLFSGELSKLQKFVQLNATGFRKILKKWDKRSKSSMKELYLSRQVEVQPCFNNEVLAEMTDVVGTTLMELESLGIHSKENHRFSSALGLLSGSDVENAVLRTLSGQDFSPERLEQLISSYASNGKPQDANAFSLLFLRICTEATLPIERLRTFVEIARPDLNYADEINERTCLHAVAGRMDLMRLVVEYGANVNVSDIYSRSPLHYAAMYGDVEAVKFLLDHGAKQELDNESMTPLLYSVKNGHTLCVELFLSSLDCTSGSEAGTSVQKFDPICLAARHGHYDICLLLLDKGAKMQRTAEGLEPLHYACREGHANICRLLISRGASLNTKDTFNTWTPLIHAASEGHVDCVRALIEAQADVDITDENGWSAQMWAIYRGHVAIAEVLQIPGKTQKEMQRGNEHDGRQLRPNEGIKGNTEIVPDIPSLSLPPPIIPVIYGHTYLDRKYHISIRLHNNPTPVSLFNSHSKSLRSTLYAVPEVGIPHNVACPLPNATETFSFTVDHLQYSVQLDVFPEYGSKGIGKATLLPSLLQEALIKGRVQALTPIYDLTGKCNGEFRCEVTVVSPFVHPRVDVGGKIATYWKSTKIVSDDSGLHHFVTASSLAQRYLVVKVHVTQDGIPVIFDQRTLPVTDFEVAVTNATYAQGRMVVSRNHDAATSTSTSHSPVLSGADVAEIHKLGFEDRFKEIVQIIESKFVTLEEVLTILPPSLGLNIEIQYCACDTPLGLNKYIDSILQTVYDHVGSRSLIFSSFHPDACAAVNLKQPNFAVFFSTHCGYPATASSTSSRCSTVTDPRCRSIEEAIRFGKANNILGLVCDARLLVQVPLMITTIKESGLVLASFGDTNDDARNTQIQERNGVDAVVVDRVFRYYIT